MDLTGKHLVVWLSAEAMETFLGVLEPREETAMVSWTVAGEVKCMALALLVALMPTLVGCAAGPVPGAVAAALRELLGL